MFDSLTGSEIIALFEKLDRATKTWHVIMTYADSPVNGEVWNMWREMISAANYAYVITT